MSHSVGAESVLTGAEPITICVAVEELTVALRFILTPPTRHWNTTCGERKFAPTMVTVPPPGTASEPGVMLSTTGGGLTVLLYAFCSTPTEPSGFTTIRSYGFAAG